MRRNETIAPCLLLCLLLLSSLTFAASKKFNKDEDEGGYEYDDYGDGSSGEEADVHEDENVAEEEYHEIDEEHYNNDGDYDEDNAEEKLEYTIKTPKVFPKKNCDAERKQVEKTAENCLIKALMPKFNSATYQDFFSQEENDYTNVFNNNNNDDNRPCNCRTPKPTSRPTTRRPTPKPTSRPTNYKCKCKCKCKKCKPTNNGNQRDSSPYGNVPIYLGEVPNNRGSRY